MGWFGRFQQTAFQILGFVVSKRQIPFVQLARLFFRMLYYNQENIKMNETGFH